MDIPSYRGAALKKYNLSVVIFDSLHEGGPDVRPLGGQIGSTEDNNCSGGGFNCH